MAKQSSKNGNGNGNGSEAAAKRAPKPGELKALFQAYDAVEKEYRAAEAAMAAAGAKRSEAVKAIAEFGAGPYEWPVKSGRLLTPTSRTNKETQKVSHFFKTQGEQEIVTVA